MTRDINKSLAAVKKKIKVIVEHLKDEISDDTRGI